MALLVSVESIFVFWDIFCFNNFAVHLSLRWWKVYVICNLKLFTLQIPYQDDFNILEFRFHEKIVCSAFKSSFILVPRALTIQLTDLAQMWALEEPKLLSKSFLMISCIFSFVFNLPIPWDNYSTFFLFLPIYQQQNLAAGDLWNCFGCSF